MTELQSIGTTSVDHLRLLLQHTKIGIWELDLQSGHAWRNARHDEIFGYPELLPEWTYEMFLEHVVPEDREEVDKAQQLALEMNEEWAFECRINRHDGGEAWIHAVGKPLFDEEGQPKKLIGHVIDITSTRQRENRLQLVTEELNHRVRNMLATIRAMVRLSARSSSDVATFSKSLEDRVAALARTHDLLVREENEDMFLSDLIDKHLGAFTGMEGRIELSTGSDVLLGTGQVQSLSMILHELLTNSIKYGALSSDRGKVALHAARKSGKINIRWQETGGPPVKAPTHEGFGSTLMKRTLGNDGNVELDFAPNGLVCQIEL